MSKNKPSVIHDYGNALLNLTATVSKLTPPPAATFPNDSNTSFNSLTLTPHPNNNCAALCVSSNPNGGVSANDTTALAASAALRAPR